MLIFGGKVADGVRGPGLKDADASSLKRMKDERFVWHDTCVMRIHEANLCAKLGELE